MSLFKNVCVFIGMMIMLGSVVAGARSRAALPARERQRNHE